MADGLNKVMLLGNLGQDPELRLTSGGDAVLNLRLATSESYLDRSKVRQERTEWHTVVIWGKRAEALSRFLSKGSRLFIEGSLRSSSYEDREGIKRFKTEVNASNVILAGSRRNGGASSSTSGDDAGPDGNGDGNGNGDSPPEDDDIPF